MHLPLKKTSSYKNTHTQLTNIPNNKIFETKRAYGSQLRTIADECTLYVIVLRHTFSGIWFSYRGERNLDYRCVYVVKNVICVITGLEWRKLRFEMERIRKKENNMTTRIWQFGYCRPQTEIGRLVVTYYSQFVAKFYLVLWAMSQSTWNCSRKWKFKPRRTSTRAQRLHGSGIVMFCLVSKALSQISFSI